MKRQIQTKLQHGLDRIMTPSTAWDEAATGGMYIIWGLVLAHPRQTFAIGAVYDVFGMAMPEWAWSVIFMALGMLQILISVRGSLRIRSYAMAFGFVWWTTILGVFTAGNSVSTAYVYIVTAATCLRSYWWLLQATRSERRQHG